MTPNPEVVFLKHPCVKSGIIHQSSRLDLGLTDRDSERLTLELTRHGVQKI